MLMLADLISEHAEPRHGKDSYAIAEADVPAAADLPTDHSILGDVPIVGLSVGVLIGELGVGGRGLQLQMLVEAEIAGSAKHRHAKAVDRIDDHRLLKQVDFHVL